MNAWVAKLKIDTARPSGNQIEVQSRGESCKLIPGPPRHAEFPSETGSKEATKKSLLLRTTDRREAE